MKKCYNCGSEDIAKKSEEKLFHFRGEPLTIPVTSTYCTNCGEVFSRETESAIIKKLGKAYVRKYGLMTSKDIIYAKNLKGVTASEMNEALGFPPGTVKALESGFTITKEQNDTIRKWLNENA